MTDDIRIYGANVRYQGHIQSWDASRGCGIVLREGSHEALFVRLHDFPLDENPPTEGEKVSFMLGMDARGHRRATKLLFTQRTPALNIIDPETAQWYHHPVRARLDDGRSSAGDGSPMTDVQDLTVPVPLYGAMSPSSLGGTSSGSSMERFRDLDYPPKRHRWVPSLLLVTSVVALVWSAQALWHHAMASEIRTVTDGTSLAQPVQHAPLMRLRSTVKQALGWG